MGSPIGVYLLDDHELMRRGLRDALQAEGDVEVVGESGSAREAARRIPALHPDVMILDVQLPDGSGIEVCRAVRGTDPQIAGLMLTTFDDDRARLAAALAGAAGFVLKQVRSRVLVQAVRQVAAGERLLDAAQVRASLATAAAGHRDARLDRLTDQEHRVLDLVADGMSNRQIGEVLHISEKTVKNHVTSVLAKLGLQRRTQAAVYAVRAAEHADHAEHAEHAED